jgi:uncharacterized protein
MQWLNEPPEWRDENGVLNVTTGAKTDFWRETHYAFIRDDGHLRYENVEGDVTATVAFRGDYRALYDQAGLMLRLDERNWVKAGIEFVGDRQRLSVVVTRDFSDWSTTPLPVATEWVHLRLSRRGSAIQVEWAPEKEGASAFQMLRLAYLSAGGSSLVGPMCCSPERAGFQAEFRNFAVGPAVAADVHT